MRADTYISGAVLLASKEVLQQVRLLLGTRLVHVILTLQQHPWDNNITHANGEDVELSFRMTKNGIVMKCEPRLLCMMFNWC